jgi:hypothetical protein
VFGDWAELHREELEARSCVDKGGKPWYSWHERPPMDDIIGRPKLLCSDVAQTPQFLVDETGEILPRHSVYYIIPKEMVTIAKLQSYLNGPQARAWLETHCQRAANGYYRLQSTVLKDLPVPTEFGETKQVTLS